MKILIFDSYDSFTYNLYHAVEELSNADVDVYRNDEIPLEDVKKYDKIILSPGPGIPSESGLLLPLIKAYAATKSILGVCLGEQAIAEVFGGKLINMKEVYHGVSSRVKLLGNDNHLFLGLPQIIEAGRYHSWLVSEEGFPDDLEITARTEEDNAIMALRHKNYDVHGVQFHPESVLTPMGNKMLKNWLVS